MGKFTLVEHKVQRATFVDHTGKKPDSGEDGVEVTVRGSVLIPKDLDDSKNIIIRLALDMGGEETQIALTMESISIFKAEYPPSDITQELVDKECIPVALAQLRNTVRNVTAAYGVTAIDLPPFGKEYEKK